VPLRNYSLNHSILLAQHQEPNLQNFVICNFFTVRSYVFRMSANKLSYEKFMKELRKMYDRPESYERVAKLVTRSERFRKCILRGSFVN